MRAGGDAGVIGIAAGDDAGDVRAVTGSVNAGRTAR